MASFLIASSAHSVGETIDIVLGQASTLLRQLRDCLMPLRAQSDEPDYVTESLQILFEWIRNEGKRLTEE